MRLLLLLLLLLKHVAHPWTLKGGHRAGFTLSRFYIKTRTRTELGPSRA